MARAVRILKRMMAVGDVVRVGRCQGLMGELTVSVQVGTLNVGRGVVNGVGFFFGLCWMSWEERRRSGLCCLVLGLLGGRSALLWSVQECLL